MCTESEDGQDLKPSSYAAIVNNRCCCKKTYRLKGKALQVGEINS